MIYSVVVAVRSYVLRMFLVYVFVVWVIGDVVVYVGVDERLLLWLVVVVVRMSC